MRLRLLTFGLAFFFGGSWLLLLSINHHLLVFRGFDGVSRLSFNGRIRCRLFGCRLLFIELECGNLVLYLLDDRLRYGSYLLTCRGHGLLLHIVISLHGFLLLLILKGGELSSGSNPFHLSIDLFLLFLIPAFWNGGDDWGDLFGFFNDALNDIGST